MNAEQFQQCWRELKGPLRARWEKLTDDDLRDIDGNQAKFQSAIQLRYGDGTDVNQWAHRWYARWAGWYEGYEEAKALSI